MGHAARIIQPDFRVHQPGLADVIELGSRRPVTRQTRGRVSTSSRPRTPLTIIPPSAVVAAYDAGVVALNGSNVAGLPDQSPNGWNGIQSNPSFQPLWSASDAAYGGRPSVTCDGVDDIIDFSLPIPAAGTTPRHYWWIGKVITWVNGRVLFGGNGGLCQDLLFASATPQLWQYNGVGSVNSNSGSTVGAAKRCRALFTNSVSDRLQCGASSVSGGNAGNGTSPDWHIGGGGAAAQFSAWSLSYMLITNRDLTPGELGALDAWALSVGYPATILV